MKFLFVLRHEILILCLFSALSVEHVKYIQVTVSDVSFLVEFNVRW